jgi:hypothetical protein
MQNRCRRDRSRSLSVLVGLLAVAALTVAGCSGSASKWPTSAQARETLTSQYHYAFVHYNDTWRAANGPRTLQISLPERADAVDGMSVSVFYASYTTFQKDIDNVFEVIAPDAASWEHDVLKRTQTTSQLNDQYQASGGLVSVMWDQSLPMLTFAFTGSGS